MSLQNTDKKLAPAALLPNNQTHRDRVGPRDRTDLFRFTLAASQRFTLRASSKNQGVQIRIIQDQNQNGFIEANEILKKTMLRRNQPQTIEIENTTAGTYFIQINQTKRGSSRYQLTGSMTSNNSDSGSNSDQNSVPDGTKPWMSQIVQLTNNFRQQNGLAPVQLSAKLNSAAQTQSQNMAMQDFFGHADKNGLAVDSRVSATGYNWSRVSENLAAGYQVASEVVEGWINSATHRQNLLDPAVTEVGVGYYFLANDTGSENWNHYWTQVFAAPQ